MNNVLIAIGVLIVAVLSALFAVPHFVDWNSYRGVIEEEASRIVGRDVRIGGDIRLQLLPAPSFSIQKLRVADAATGSGEPLFRADRVDAKLSIIPLVRGILEANEIELVKPVLRFVADEAGRGNWHNLVQGRGSLPFVPNDVALQSVKITDGTLSMQDRGGKRERLMLARLNGQLSAPALEGPYKFRGNFGDERTARELRFTTAPPDADGAVQFKAALKDIATGASAALDGRLRDLSGQPSMTGELTALLPLTAAARAGSAAKPTQAAAAQADLKAEVSGDSNLVAMKNISIAIDRSGRPEVLSGNATFAWDSELSTVVQLSAPWIDLDAITGNPDGSNPLMALAAFSQRINGLTSSTGKTHLTLEIEQANLGREAVGGVRVETKSAEGALQIEDLRASLPGGARLEIQGRLTGQDASTAFDGDLAVRGNSIARIAAWITGGATTVAPAHDRAFQLRSRLSAEAGRSALRNISAEYGESVLEGSVDYAWSGARKLRIAVEGPLLDARAVAPAKLSLRGLAESMGGKRPAQGTDATGSPLDIALNIKTNELILPDRTLRDVAAVVSTSAQGLTIERLHYGAEHDVSVTLEGQLTNPAAASTPDAPAMTRLRGALTASNAEGLQSLSDFLGFQLTSLMPKHLAHELVPLRLAGTLTETETAAQGKLTKATDIVADGQLGQADAKIRVSLSAGLDNWRTAPADIDLVLLAPEPADLAGKAVAALRGYGLPARVEAAQRAPAPQSRLAIRASGVPATGLSTAVRLDSPEATLFLQGRTIAKDGADVSISADMTVDARDGRSVLAGWSGLNLTVVEPLAFGGTAHLEARSGNLALSEMTFVSNSGTTAQKAAQVSGSLSLAPASPTAGTGASKAAPRRLSGDLRFSWLNAAALLTPVLQAANSEAEAAIKAASGRSAIWPEANFDFGRNRALEMAMTLRADTLYLADGVSLANARLTYLARPDAIEVKDLTGTALGGLLVGNAQLERHPSGAVLAAQLQLSGAKLDSFGGSGTSATTLQLSGRGLNPAGLVASMSGNGSVNLTAANATAVTPESLQAVINTALKAAPEKLGATLRAGIAADAARGTLAIGTRAIALQVQDGVARTVATTIATPTGRVVTQSALDLSTFAISGDWRVETALQPPAPPTPPASSPANAAPVPLPAVVQRYALHPADLEPGRPQRRAPYDVDALDRELAVRKVEHDLAEL